MNEIGHIGGNEYFGTETGDELIKLASSWCCFGVRQFQATESANYPTEQHRSITASSSVSCAELIPTSFHAYFFLFGRHEINKELGTCMIMMVDVFFRI